MLFWGVRDHGVSLVHIWGEFGGGGISRNYRLGCVTQGTVPWFALGVNSGSPFRINFRCEIQDGP